MLFSCCGALYDLPIAATSLRYLEHAGDAPFCPGTYRQLAPGLKRAACRVPVCSFGRAFAHTPYGRGNGARSTSPKAT